MDEYEIIVVGAGPAGSAAAIQIANLEPDLARRTLLLDRARFPRQKLCAGGVTTHADALLAKLGVRIEVPSVAIHGARFVYKCTGFTFRWRNLFRVVRREEFDAALVRCAVERGASLKDGEALQDFRNEDSGVVVQTDKGTYKCQVLIGADGANSRVRQRLGLVRWDRISRLIEVLTPVDAHASSEFVNSTAVFDFTPLADGVQGYYWDFPSLKAGVPVMNRGLFDSRVLPDQPRAPLKQVFANLLGSRNVNMDAVILQGHPERWYDASAKHSADRVILAGDAAGTEPLFGEGISHALDFGMRAATAAVTALREGEFSFRNYEAQIAWSALGRRLQAKRALANFAYSGVARSWYPIAFGVMRSVFGR